MELSRSVFSKPLGFSCTLPISQLKGFTIQRTACELSSRRKSEKYFLDYTRRYNWTFDVIENTHTILIPISKVNSDM